MGAGVFFVLSRSRARSQKRTGKREEKKRSAKKSESAEREFALFPPPTVEIRFQSLKLLVRGKARVLSKMYYYLYLYDDSS